MTKKELHEQVFQTYAMLGELSVKRKQLIQTIEFIDNQINDLESKIVKLSQIEVKETLSETESSN